VQTLRRNFRILIAEDTILHRNLLKHILTKQFNIDESYLEFVNDGQQAVLTIMKSLDEKCLEEPDDEWNQPSLFDMLILDYHMPLLTGLDVMKKCMPIYKKK
jgi:CheY-like chemotaxis protein